MSLPTLVPLSIPLASILSLVALVLWYIVSSILSWRRLSAFPSASPIAHFSYLWLAYTTFGGKQFWVHRELHRKHGASLVRIGPNELMTDDIDLLQKISSTRSNFPRDTWYQQGKFNPYIDNMFSVLEPKTHTEFKTRRIAAYSGRENPDLEVGVDAQTRNLVDLLRNKYAAGVKEGDSANHAPLLDLGKTSNYFTLDVITRLAFGSPFGYLADEFDHYGFLANVYALWPLMSTSANVPWIRNIIFSKPFLKLMGPKTSDKKGFGALMGVAEQQVGKRFQPDAKVQQDMLGSMIKRGLSQIECEAEGLFMVMAGTESTASAIRAILVNTMTSPRVYASLKAEIAAAVATGIQGAPVSPIIKLKEAKQLPYLQAVIYEGLRMRPALLGLLPKVVPASTGGAFDNLLPGVPAGTAICMNLSSMLRSQKLFGPDADVFRPERFMELESPELRRKMELDVEMVFGYGQWMCVGKTVAFMELNKAVFELFRNFDLELIQALKPSDILSYGTFLEDNLLVKVTESSQVVASRA